MSVTTTVTKIFQEVTPAGYTPVTVTQTIDESGEGSTEVTRTLNRPVGPGVRTFTSTMTITDH